jgi:hypothetical protein
MKTLLVFSCVAALVVGMNACNKSAIDPDSSSAARNGVTSTSATGPHSLTTVDAASLPAAITTYISTNYAGATIKEALKGPEGNYAVAVTVNSEVKLLLFKADGTFVKEVAGRPGRTPGDSVRHHAPGDSLHHHAPGDSAHHPKPVTGDSAHHPKPVTGDSAHHPRPAGGGPASTTIATSSLPAAITTYINTNYAGATINRAGQDKKTGDYVVLITTTDNKRIGLLFGSDGTFKKALTGK